MGRQAAEDEWVPSNQNPNELVKKINMGTRDYVTNTKKTRAADPHLRRVTGKWDKHDAKFMTEMRKVEIKPTRVASESTLSSLGLLQDAQEMFKTIGLGQVWREQDYTYPELVREFCASCRVIYTNPQEPKASEGTLCFFLKKEHFKIPINVFCEIYGFEQGEQIKFPEFTRADDFWDLIGDGPYIPREAKITFIRNPVIRIVAKIIGNTFFCKSEAGAVRYDELWMLFLGVRHLLQGYEDVEIPNVNYGAIMCAMFEGIKKNTAKTNVLYIGTILTPLFRYTKIDLAKSEILKKVSFVDTNYLDSCHIIKKIWIYKFQDRDGVACFVHLPHAITRLTSRDSLEFLPGPEYLCPDPFGDKKRTSRRRTTSAPRQPHQPHDDPVDDDCIHEEPFVPHHALPTFPEADLDEFILPEVPPHDDISPCQKWIIKATKTNNSLMRKILSVVSRRTTEGTSVETTGTAQPAGPSTQRGLPPARSQDGRLRRCRRQSGHDQSSSESLPDLD